MALEDVEFYPVTSTNVESIGYSYDDGTLYVKFLNQAIYWYASVPPQVYDGMLEAPSAGKYVWTHLRDQYEYGRAN